MNIEEVVGYWYNLGLKEPEPGCFVRAMRLTTCTMDQSLGAGQLFMRPDPNRVLWRGAVTSEAHMRILNR